MTSEERFHEFEECDRRIQRKHEALAKTIELIAATHRDLASKLDILTERTIQAMDTFSRLGK